MPFLTETKHININQLGKNDLLTFNRVPVTVLHTKLTEKENLKCNIKKTRR